jgi:glycosyltransferase involved in cell wall biosynthesis
MTRWIYRHSDAIVTYGDHVSRFVVTEGANPAGVFSAENAVDNMLYSRHAVPARIDALRKRLQAGDDHIVLAVSRLVPEKGLDILIDAAAGLGPPVCLVIVGTGPLAHALRERAASLGVKLQLIEGLPPAEMPPLYAAADVFVMPSVTTGTFKEPWGLACNEAMCQGTPVVTTTAVGAAAGGLVADDQTGLVVPERDSDALRIALQRLLTDQAFAARLGENGRARVARTDYSGMVDGFEHAIRFALTHRGTCL